MTNSKNELSTPDTCSAAKLSGFFGISERQIQKLTESGVLIKIANGKYPVAQNIQLWIDYKSSYSVEGEDKDTLQREKLVEEIRRLKMDNDERAGLSAPIDEIIQLGAPIMQHAAKIIDRIGEDCRVICPKIDEMEADEINQKVGVPVKNALADVIEKIANRVPVGVES